MVHVLSDVLKPKYIYDFFSRSAVEKGHAYKAQGRVSELEISEDLTHIRAQVRGSSASKYRVDIQLDFGHDRLDALNGECSCPMTFNCKHVVATLLEALSGKPQPPNTASAGKQVELVPRAPPPLPYEVNEWLEKFGTALRGDDYPAELNQRLLYCLDPSHDGVHTPVLAVSLRSVRVLKGGDFATNYAQPSVHDFAAERAPKYYRDSRYRHFDTAFAPGRADTAIASNRNRSSCCSGSSRPAARSGSITSDRRCVGESYAKGGWSGARPASAALLRSSSSRERSRSTPNRRSMSTRRAGRSDRWN